MGHIEVSLALIVKEQKRMSDALVKLTSQVTSAVALIESLQAENADLKAKLDAATSTTGTPDSALASLSLELDEALSPKPVADEPSTEAPVEPEPTSETSAPVPVNGPAGLTATS